MLEVSRPGHHLLKLMLEVFPNYTPDGIDKSLGFSQALAKEGLESLPANRNVSLVLYLTLVLLPAEQSGVLQEASRKRNSVRARGTDGSKVIFALLEEISSSLGAFYPGKCPGTKLSEASYMGLHSAERRRRWGPEQVQEV